ncbi:MAG TPA: hybrid sensor histidine kinase/response regulator [Candidatus Binatia bacterium]|nr:hybrid sensor histidine kinase/response regulator [Candidatus Binatia bacterium]
MIDALTQILLVEDNPADARLLREVLKEVPGCPFGLAHVEQLGEALEHLREKHFDVVLLDLSLPDAQGLDGLARVRDVAPSVPILVLTGLDDEEMAVNALRVGAQDYLVKGQVNGGGLVRAVRYARERKQVTEENARLFRQVQHNLERLRLLREFDHAVTSTLDLSTLLDVLMGKIELVLPYSATTLRLLNPKNGLLEPAAWRNVDGSQLQVGRGKSGPGLAGLVFESKALVVIRNFETDTRVKNHEFFRMHGLTSYLGLPLIAKDAVLGILSFYTKEEHEFSEEEIEFLSTLADRTAMAIYNAQLYERTRDQAIELNKANKAKDEFLSVMSHELRTPLNVISGYAEAARQGVFGEINTEQDVALRKIMSCAKDLLWMISSILQATRIEADIVNVEKNEIAVGRLLDELKSSYDVSLGKSVSLHWDYPPEFPTASIDGEKLMHILQNLINNAIKFTEEGRVTVSARQVPGANKIEFRVTDTGIGIPQEMLPLIFEKFRQGDGSSTRTHGGVGLGLYIVKRFTEMLGGELNVSSELGKGSTFTVTLPISGLPEALDGLDGSARGFHV